MGKKSKVVYRSGTTRSYREDKQKYPLDLMVSINRQTWRVAEYRHKFGREWIYILQYESVDGVFETISVNETSLTAIIESGSYDEKD